MEVIQGSVAGSDLCSVFVNSLTGVHLPVTAFVGNAEFVADITTLNEANVPFEINVVVSWAAENFTSLSIDKCSVLHCIEQQQMNSTILINPSNEIYSQLC